MATDLSDAALATLYEILAQGGVAVIATWRATELRAAGLVERVRDRPRRGYTVVRITDLD